MNLPGHEGLNCRKMRSKLIQAQLLCHISSQGFANSYASGLQAKGRREVIRV